MAEGFGRAYGGDVMESKSAGLSPAVTVPSLTRQVMLEKNVPIDGQFPKGIEVYFNTPFDVVVNMSQQELPRQFKPNSRPWTVADPFGQSAGIYRQVRDEIENQVMRLILELRRLRDTGGAKPTPPPPPPPPVRKFGLF